VLALLGSALATFTLWARTGTHPFKRALEAISLNAILFLPRAQSADCWRTIVWFCVIPYLILAATARTGLQIPSHRATTTCKGQAA
jgi:hypothetical protein